MIAPARTTEYRVYEYQVTKSMYTAIKLHHPEPEIEDKSGNNLLMTKKFVMISKLKSSRNLKLIISIAHYVLLVQSLPHVFLRQSRLLQLTN